MNTEVKNLRFSQQHPEFGKPVIPNFQVSHAKRIKFRGGTTIELNRAERRRAHIYNRDLTRED